VAAGPVKLIPDGPLGAAVEGSLLDISDGGFRASHRCPTLVTGQVVHFEHSSRAGQARLVWNRITGREVESGFCYVEP